MRTAVKLATVTAASTLALGIGTPLATAQAATTQNGLVNVSLTNTTIQVPGRVTRRPRLSLAQTA